METLNEFKPFTPILNSLDFNSYSNEELYKLEMELIKKNQFIKMENVMLERFRIRVTSMNASLEEMRMKQDLEKQKREKKKKEIKMEALLLTLDQKSEIATRELEELRDEIHEKKQEWGKVLDNYKVYYAKLFLCKREIQAELEEVDMRLVEIKKAMYEFKRDIVQQAVNQRTGKIMAERILRYFEDKIRLKVIHSTFY